MAKKKVLTEDIVSFEGEGAADTTISDGPSAAAGTTISDGVDQDAPIPDQPYPGSMPEIDITAIGDVRFVDPDDNVWYLDEQRKGLFILRRTTR